MKTLNTYISEKLYLNKVQKKQYHQQVNEKLVINKNISYEETSCLCVVVKYSEDSNSLKHDILVFDIVVLKSEQISNDKIKVNISTDFLNYDPDFSDHEEIELTQIENNYNKYYYEKNDIYGMYTYIIGLFNEAAYELLDDISKNNELDFDKWFKNIKCKHINKLKGRKIRFVILHTDNPFHYGKGKDYDKNECDYLKRQLEKQKEYSYI